tara:strand:+ start:1979 stop:2737 length:759 start_codon:yes stop_codon:yes gene_type:complete
MRYFLLIIAVLFIGCESNPKKESNWIFLFDGKTTNGWRGYNSNEIPPGWIAKEGMLMFERKDLQLEQDYEGGRDLIYYKEQFDEFELYLEWKIPPGGNSGIFYHVQEGYNFPGEASPEYQLIDDVNYTKIHDVTEYNKSFGESEPEKLQDWQKTGANYAMHTVSEGVEKVLFPAGEWNSTRIIFTNENVEHWLNGVKLLSFVPWSEEWDKLRNSGKWNDYPDYGKYKTGYISFQDHGSSLWFRNIKLKKIVY